MGREAGPGGMFHCMTKENNVTLSMNDEEPEQAGQP